MKYKELEDKLKKANETDNSAFELRGAYNNCELWANGNRLEAGSVKDCYNSWIKNRFKQKYQKTESKIQFLKKMIREEVRKVRLKEDTFNDEVDELATNLIDYLGTELPAAGWKTNPRIVGWFKENGIKINTPIAQDIYRKALELNRDNESKSRKYLDN